MTSTHWFCKENPLTEYLLYYGSIDEVAAALAYNPLDGIDVSALSLVERNELLVCDKQPLAPTILSLEVAMTIHGMVRGSLRMRNPLLASGRWQVDCAIEDAQIGVNFSQLPPVPGSCLYLVKGITGLSKTVTLKRALTTLGKQVIIHPEMPEANWKGATQLLYLYVGMAHDGSRGGLIGAILAEIDRRLGTDHSLTLPRKYKTIEKQVQAVIALFHKYLLGVLVIDEIQWLNLTTSDQSSLMHLFLLSLVNSGIPTVLSGNPAGFAGLAAHTQTTSRAAERKEAFFHPCGALPGDDEWDMVARGVTDYYLLPRPAIDLDKSRLLLKTLSGGIARCALALWCNAQRSALFYGRGSIESADLQEAYDDHAFSGMRPICDGFSRRDPTLLWTWKRAEIPVSFYAEAWDRLDPSAAPAPAETKGTSGSAPNPSATAGETQAKGASAPSSTGVNAANFDPEKQARKERAKLKGQLTRQRKREAAQAALASELEPGDMRLDGLKQHALTGLNALMGSSGESPAEADLKD